MSPAASGIFCFMRRIKLVVEYDGTDFSGWQSQKNGRTVQDEMNRALRELLQEEITVTGAGRTDAGVHARGQVCHFDTDNPMEGWAIMRGLNGLLNSDVVVRSAEEAPGSFHARYSARSRTYKYFISQSPTALARKYRWYVGHPLDLGLMQTCADALIGEHDFQAFCKVDSSASHFRCQVTSAQWIASGTDVAFEISANRFLYGMVRSLVGTMVDVGRGHLTVEEFMSIKAGRDRTEASSAAPAAGLVLENVEYE